MDHMVILSVYILLITNELQKTQISRQAYGTAVFMEICRANIVLLPLLDES